MKQNFSHQQVLDIHSNLSRIKGLPGVKINYAINKNKRVLETIVKDIFDAEPAVTDAFNDFEEERIKLCKTHCIKDKDDNPVKFTERDGTEIFKFPEGSKFDVELEKLQKSEKYKDAYKQREKDVKEFRSFMGSKIDIDIFMVKEEYLPEDILTEQMDVLWFMIED